MKMIQSKWLYIVAIAITIVAGFTIWKLSSFSPWQTTAKKINITESVKTEEPTEAKYSIEIPAISVSAPVITGVDPSNENLYDRALTGGVLELPSAGKLGVSGNITIYGHSSANQKSPYEKVFAKLNDLKPGDEIRLTRDGNTYSFSVQTKKVVEATDLSVLKQTDDQTLTLITCWPIGTDKQRLIVIAKR